MIPADGSESAWGNNGARAGSLRSWPQTSPSPSARTAIRVKGSVTELSGRSVGKSRWIPPRARTAAGPANVGENQQVAQNVVSSTKVSSRGSSRIWKFRWGPWDRLPACRSGKTDRMPIPLLGLVDHLPGLRSPVTSRERLKGQRVMYPTSRSIPARSPAGRYTDWSTLKPPTIAAQRCPGQLACSRPLPARS